MGDFAVSPVTSEDIKRQAIALGFHAVGIAAIATEPSAAEQASQLALRAWLAQGFQADMGWMESERRQNIRQVMPAAKSIICVR